VSSSTVKKQGQEIEGDTKFILKNFRISNNARASFLCTISPDSYVGDHVKVRGLKIVKKKKNEQN